MQSSVRDPSSFGGGRGRCTHGVIVDHLVVLAAEQDEVGSFIAFGIGHFGSSTWTLSLLGDDVSYLTDD